MREFAFSIQYEEGADQLGDVFAEYDDLIAYSLEGCATNEQFWRVEWLTGPPAALDQVEAIRADDSLRSESITERTGEGSVYHDTFVNQDDERIFYAWVDDIRRCETVHTITAQYLPPGVLFETHRHQQSHDWRVLTRSDEKIGIVYDVLSAVLREGLSFSMRHLRDADGLRENPFSSVTLPGSQQKAIEAAVEAGYYETPRAVSLDDLADDLGVPRSTLSYRLRRAESALATAFADR